MEGAINAVGDALLMASPAEMDHILAVVAQDLGKSAATESDLEDLDLDLDLEIDLSEIRDRMPEVNKLIRTYFRGGKGGSLSDPCLYSSLLQEDRFAEVTPATRPTLAPKLTDTTTVFCNFNAVGSIASPRCERRTETGGVSRGGFRGLGRRGTEAGLAGLTTCIE